MLRRVTVENYALIDSLEIEFSEGLNIITGETGAGKSLLLGALSVILGGKADASVLRDKTRPCVIEAEFGIAGFGLEEAFRNLDLDYADDTVVRRVINPAGKSRAYVNELPVTLAALREIGSRLVDIHSQHQTLLLGSNKFQTVLVDSVAGQDALLAGYRERYERLRRIARELEDLREAARNSRSEEEYLRFQAEQLRGANLREGEQAELEQLQNELAHAAEIREAMGLSEGLLTEDENGVLSRLKNVEQLLRRTEAVFPKSGELAERVRSVAYELKDIAGELGSEAERVDVDPARLEKTEARLDLLYSLQQKHRVTDADALVAVRDEIEAKLAGLESFDARIGELEKEAAAVRREAVEEARKISAGRKAAVPGIETYVRETTASLGMPSVRFRVEIEPAPELTPTGADRIRFLFTANRNMPLQPVEQIASGGEMSRLMLCLKSLTARHRQLPAVIFDEIDTGISGEIADRMGQIIHALSARMQVINITHLPQVAGKGKNHYYVYKEETEDATNTRIRKLTPEERVQEIAKMLSGSDVTQAAVEQARVLIRE